MLQKGSSSAPSTDKTSGGHRKVETSRCSARDDSQGADSAGIHRLPMARAASPSLPVPAPRSSQSTFLLSDEETNAQDVP